MQRSECGFASPPADNTREREAMDRFEDFLRVRGGVVQRVNDGTYVKGQTLPPWRRYHLRFLAWRMEQV